MTFEQFERFVHAIQAYDSREKELAKGLEPFNSSWTIVEFCPTIRDTIIRFVDEFFDDKTETFSWWLYEDVEKVIKIDGAKHDVKDIQNFYNVMIQLRGNL